MILHLYLKNTAYNFEINALKFTDSAKDSKGERTNRTSVPKPEATTPTGGSDSAPRFVIKNSDSSNSANGSKTRESSSKLLLLPTEDNQSKKRRLSDDSQSSEIKMGRTNKTLEDSGRKSGTLVLKSADNTRNDGKESPDVVDKKFLTGAESAATEVSCKENKIKMDESEAASRDTNNKSKNNFFLLML